MVSTSLAAASGAFAGALISGIVTYYTTLLQQERADARERATPYIDRKLHYAFTSRYTDATP